MQIGRDQHAARRRQGGDRRIPAGEPDRLRGVRNRVVEVALGAPDHRAVDQRRGQGGIEPDRLVDIGQRAVEIAERLLGGAAVLVRIGFVRIEPDRLVVIGKRPGVLAFGAPGVAAVMEDGGVRRTDPERVVEVGNRDVVLALVEIGRAAHVVERLIGFQAQRLGGVGDHPGVVALLVPADRAPEIHRGELLAGKHLQRDDPVAGVDLLVGGRALAGAERPELRVGLGRDRPRPQRGGDEREQGNGTAHDNSQSF